MATDMLEGEVAMLARFSKTITKRRSEYSAHYEIHSLALVQALIMGDSPTRIMRPHTWRYLPRVP